MTIKKGGLDMCHEVVLLCHAVLLCSSRVTFESYLTSPGIATLPYITELWQKCMWETSDPTWDCAFTIHYRTLAGVYELCNSLTCAP